MFAKDWEHHLVILVMVDFTSSFCIPDCILYWLHSKPAQLTVAVKSEVTPLRNLYGFSHRLIDQTCAVFFLFAVGWISHGISHIFSMSYLNAFDPNGATWYAQLSMNPKHTTTVATGQVRGHRSVGLSQTEPELLCEDDKLANLVYSYMMLNDTYGS
jgi:hypothetical protein